MGGVQFYGPLVEGVKIQFKKKSEIYIFFFIYKTTPKTPWDQMYWGYTTC